MIEVHQLSKRFPLPGGQGVTAVDGVSFSVSTGEWSFKPTRGFCKAATIEEIIKHGFVLTPGRYVGAEEQEDDSEPFGEKYPRLVADLQECFKESRRLEALIESQLLALKRVGSGSS